MKFKETLITAMFVAAATAANAAKQCVMCAPGKYADGSTGGACKECEAGSYCMQGYKFPCPEKTYNDKTGQISDSACKDCGNLTAKADRSGCNQPITAEYVGTATVQGVVYYCNCRVQNEAGAWSQVLTGSIGPICDSVRDGTNNCGRGLCADFCRRDAMRLGASAVWN
jgi:hypothetical protein